MKKESATRLLVVVGLGQEQLNHTEQGCAQLVHARSPGIRKPCNFRRGPTRRSQKSLVFPTPKSGAAVSIKIASGSGLA